ncbi:MAG: MFS transporter, partial [Nocardioidaceae bacterium]
MEPDKTDDRGDPTRRLPRTGSSLPLTKAERARRAAVAGKRAAAFSGRAASGTVRAARRASHAQGAGETGLARLI